MKILHRWLAAAAWAAMSAGAALAAPFPARPLTIVVPTPPGGTAPCSR